MRGAFSPLYFAVVVAAVARLNGPTIAGDFFGGVAARGFPGISFSDFPVIFPVIFPDPADKLVVDFFPRDFSTVIPPALPLERIRNRGLEIGKPERPGRGLHGFGAVFSRRGGGGIFPVSGQKTNRRGRSVPGLQGPDSWNQFHITQESALLQVGGPAPPFATGGSPRCAQRGVIIPAPAASSRAGAVRCPI